MPKRIPRRVRKSRRKTRRRVPRSLNPMNQSAYSIETLDFGDLKAGQLYNQNFQLNEFPRSSAIAACYRWYRAVSVEFEYTPYYNVFTQGSSNQDLPQLFSIMDRSQNSGTPPPQYALTYMESMGAKARQFTKKIKISYKPNWCSSGLLLNTVDGGGHQVSAIKSMGLTPQYGWLASPAIIDTFPNGKAYPPGAGIVGNNQDMIPDWNATTPGFENSQPNGSPFVTTSVSTNSVLYNGHILYLHQDNPSATAYIGQVRMTVKWEFKHPQAQFYKVGDREPPPLDTLTE